MKIQVPGVKLIAPFLCLAGVLNRLSTLCTEAVKGLLSCVNTHVNCLCVPSSALLGPCFVN